eukprot:gnl/TRDRNA2_/TRDRNA2_43198_c0_seq1.p2 gnl/TRDRNA2_/TRDRNA2_43198_c0~~gnl/TRDRNA2_/TRDRNA2_43198_c0_seq1.p2  ORF type:complete len:337 (-),score=77.79 gnl/TRDRNA2_/TRDRNA2_43198_c0_seq1:184-1194(-)
MVKKARKAENRKLAITQALKITRKENEKRAVHNIPTPTPGQSFSHIKNKHKRSRMVALAKREQKKQKSKVRRAKREAVARGEEVVQGETRTIEKMREPDETIVPEDDDEVEGDEAFDEFEKYFNQGKTPRVLITTQQHPSGKMFNLLKELACVIPNCAYHPRKDYSFKQICSFASKRDFTDIMLFHEKAKVVQGVYLCHLPNGPTAYFRLTRLKLGQEMKGGATCNASHNPELILNNFTTRLGRRIGRQLAAIFPQAPDFKGRRTVTFHNQRDFIFFRHYRYIFKKDGTKVGLKEIGPRFTLKLRYLQHGTFNAKQGEYEYIWRPDSQVSRKRFFV